MWYVSAFAVSPSISVWYTLSRWCCHTRSLVASAIHSATVSPPVIGSVLPYCAHRSSASTARNPFASHVSIVDAYR